MKTRTILIAAVMFLGLTAAAFAQATFSVGSIPVTAVNNTGLTELTGAVTFSVVSGNSVAGTITINYGVQITSAISAAGVSNALTGGATCTAPTINTASSNNASGLLVINVNGNGTTGCTGGSFAVTGVRVAVASTGLTSLSGSISATSNAITAGQTSVVVISSIAAGIASVGTSSKTLGGGITATAGTINAVTGAITQPTATALEGFLNAWGSPTNSTNSGVAITLSAAPSAGVSVTFPANLTAYGAASNSNWVTINSDGTARGSTYVFTSASSSLTAYYQETSANDTTTAMLLDILPTLSVSGSATYPLAAQTVTYTVSLAPIGVALNSDGSVITTPVPRYVSSPVGPATLYSVLGSTTVLLVPFAQTAAAIGYNTGLAISNSTTDPGTKAMGYTTATAQLGTVSFYFYPTLPSPTGTLPTPVTYTTAAGSPGSGLDSSGRVISGATYTVLLTQLWAAAGQTGDFNGYVFIITNFTNAHAFFTISNFSGFSEGGLALVITGSRALTPEALNN